MISLPCLVCPVKTFKKQLGMNRLPGFGFIDKGQSIPFLINKKRSLSMGQSIGNQISENSSKLCGVRLYLCIFLLKGNRRSSVLRLKMGIKSCKGVT